jgi:hypothetical protein
MLIKRKLLLLIFLFSILFSPVLVLSVDITSCKSDVLNWLCDRGKKCTCKISGSCSNGNLLVYDEYLINPLCSPQIIGDTATIDWTYFNTSKDYVKAHADCDEGRSTEKMIIITAPAGTTTTIKTTTTTTPYGGCGTDGYCEFTENECLGGYEDCPDYDYECSTDEKCCCYVLTGTTTTQKKQSGFNYGWLILPILILIGVFVYFFFIKKGGKEETIEKFRKLYEKWSKFAEPIKI